MSVRLCDEDCGQALSRVRAGFYPQLLIVIRPAEAMGVVYIFLTRNHYLS